MKWDKVYTVLTFTFLCFLLAFKIASLNIGIESLELAQECSENPDWTLATWQITYAVVGLVFVLFAMFFVGCDLIQLDQSWTDIMGIVTYFSWPIGILYLLFSIPWGIYGATLLSGDFSSCEEIIPDLWWFSRINLIILPVLTVINPITLELPNVCRNVFFYEYFHPKHERND